MENARITGIPSAKKPDGKHIEDPIIVKIAKLGIILSDRDTDLETKFLCVKAAERMGYITGEQATQLLLYRKELEDFFEVDDEEDAT